MELKTNRVTFLIYILLLLPTIAFSEENDTTKDLSSSYSSSWFSYLPSPSALLSRLDPRSLLESYISTDPAHIRFLLYDKRLNPDEYKELHYNDIKSLGQAHFRRHRPLKVLIHGFKKSGTGKPKEFPQDAKNVYLEQTDNNVIIVDWGRLANPATGDRPVATDVFYSIAMSNVPKLGLELGKLLVFLYENGAVSHPKQIHLVGFSLGAHGAGIAGAHFKDKTKQAVGRITGLDPAKVLYQGVKEGLRLDENDAHFVDIVHSSSFGIFNKTGHADFYINGGEFQPDCIQIGNRSPRQVLQNLYHAFLGSCGHSRAPMYYTHSIRAGDGAISGCGCDSWKEYLSTCKNRCRKIVNFGEFCPNTARGTFYLEIAVDDLKRF